MADDRLISADKFKRFLCSCCNILNPGEPCEPADCNVMLLVDQQPTVDSAPVVHARWIAHDFDLDYECSACGYTTEWHLSKY